MSTSVINSADSSTAHFDDTCLRSLTRRDVAGLLGISIASVDRLLAGGALPSFKAGPRARRVRAADLADFITRGGSDSP